jgi:hypothetical protein
MDNLKKRAGLAVHYGLIQTANKIELPENIDLKVRNSAMRITQTLQQRKPIPMEDIEFLEEIYKKYRKKSEEE